MRELNDGATVDCRDTISDVQQATAVGWAAVNDSANFVRDNWKGEIRGELDIKTQVE